MEYFVYIMGEGEEKKKFIFKVFITDIYLIHY